MTEASSHARGDLLAVTRLDFSTLPARTQLLGVWVALTALAVVGVFTPEFVTAGNLQNLMRAVSVIGIAGLGQTFVIAAGGIDLSVGQLMGLVVVLSAWIMRGDTSLILPIVVLAIAIGIGVGLLNGAAVVTTGIYPMILTFGMLSILRGVIFLITDRTIGSIPKEFAQLDQASLGPIPLPFVVLAAMVFLSWFVFTHTPFGRYVTAVGSNEANARRAGIGVGRVKVAVYALSGLSGAIAGLLLLARLGTGYTLAGQGMELNAIVAVVLGGTSFGGGRGRMLGTVGGALVLVLLNNILNLRQVEPYVQDVVSGVIILAAIAFYTARRT